MSRDLDISVLICTRNRAASLGRLLKSLSSATIPEGVGWEVIVVDNNSEDETIHVVRSFDTALPVRRVFEPRIGLSNARNAGMRAATGSYICWTDDDVIVSPDWIHAFWRAFKAHPDAAVFGGSIRPAAESPPTSWFEPRMHSWPLASVVAFRDMGPRELPLLPQPDRLPWGANFVTRRREQMEYPFDPNLSFGEETDVISRLLKSGVTGWWVPGATVTHMIPAERQTLFYVDQYFRRAGVAAAYLWERDGLDNSVAAGAPSWTTAGDAVLHLLALMSSLVSSIARLLGLDDPSLRSRARRSYIRGVQHFRATRRETQALLS
jgi:glycosyltransferase involved in cell wall biosynthesis